MAQINLGTIAAISFDTSPPTDQRILWYDGSETDPSMRLKYFNPGPPAGWYPVNTSPPGIGTVTSVGLQMPADLFSVAGSPITSNGTFAVTKATQNRNLFFASSPTTNGVAPSFRAIVDSDIPATIARNFVNTIIANTLSDLPAPVGGVITLNGETLIVPFKLDLEGNRLVLNDGCAIVGFSSEVSLLFSTGLTDYLITTIETLSLKNISLTADRVINLDGGGTATLDWDNVNFVDCPEVGRIGNCSNFINFSCAFINSQDLKLFGTFGTVSYDTTIFTGNITQPYIIFESTFVATRRARFVFCPFVAGVGLNAIRIQPGATIPTDQFILFRCDFSGGSALYIDGATDTSPISDWVENKGIINSATITQYYMINNTTVTGISVAGTFVKIAGLTTSGPIVKRFTNTDNRARFTGAISTYVNIRAIASLTSSANNIIILRIAINGVTIASSEQQVNASITGRSENISIQDVVLLNTNDDVEIYVANQASANGITVSELNVIITKLV